MIKVHFISDFFSDELAGGAELVDAVLCEFLVSRGIEVVKIRSIDTDNIKNSLSEESY